MALSSMLVARKQGNVFNPVLESPHAVEGQLSAEDTTRWTKKVSRRAKEEKSFLDSEEFDLTESDVPAIIICTSILWRADKPGAKPGL